MRKTTERKRKKISEFKVQRNKNKYTYNSAVTLYLQYTLYKAWFALDACPVVFVSGTRARLRPEVVSCLRCGNGGGISLSALEKKVKRTV